MFKQKYAHHVAHANSIHSSNSLGGCHPWLLVEHLSRPRFAAFSVTRTLSLVDFSHAFACMLFALTGGEGATAREVLRHHSVEKVVMVDIDKVRPRCKAGGERQVHMQLPLSGSSAVAFVLCCLLGSDAMK